MGLLLDSSVLVAAEREQVPVSELLDGLRRRHGPEDVVLSAIGVVELEHGVFRARTPQQASKRRAYLDTLFAAVPVLAFTPEMCQTVAQIDSEARSAGNVIPFADLLIGGTAMYLAYGLVTQNERHFRMIAGLNVLAY